MPMINLKKAALALAASAFGAISAVDAAPGPLGLEFRINTATQGGQQDAAIARDADGDYVVAWTEYHRGLNVFAQRYNAAGMPQGSQFQVNPATRLPQSLPTVATDAQGNFVIAWAGYGGTDGSELGIYAQRYLADGRQLGSVVRVNQQPVTGFSALSMAMDANGDWAVAWDSNGGDGSSYGVFAQRFNVDSDHIGPAIQVNTYTRGSQREPAIAMSADGAFVVVWSSDDQDGSSRGIYGQRFKPAGTPVGREFRVNQTTVGAQLEPAVAMDAKGDFVVAWHSYAAGADDPDVIARSFSATAGAGPEFRVHDAGTGVQSDAAVAMDASGDFAIAWSDDSVGGTGSSDIVGRRFTADGRAEGPQFRINTANTFSQRFPALAMDADGDLVAAWQSQGQDGNDYGLYGQRFRGSGTADLALRLNVGVAAGGTVRYTATLSNLAPPQMLTGSELIDPALGSAINPNVRFTLSDSASILGGFVTSVPMSCSSTRAKPACRLDQPLRAGASATVSFVVTAARGDAVSVAAIASSESADEVPGNNTARRDVSLGCVPGKIEFTAAGYSVGEAAGSAVVRVTRTGGSCGSASVQVETGADTARPFFDYTRATTTLSWADGESGDKLFMVSIRNDRLRERDEQFNVDLARPQGASLGARSHTAVTIVDDEG